MFYVMKIIISALLIVIISEISKRFTIIGAILASAPVISVIALSLLYLETKNIEKASALSTNIFWLILPSLSFYIIFPVFLKHKMQFIFALPLSLLIMAFFYLLMIYILKKIGIQF